MKINICAKHDQLYLFKPLTKFIEVSKNIRHFSKPYCIFFKQGQLKIKNKLWKSLPEQDKHQENYREQKPSRFQLNILCTFSFQANICQL